MVATRISEIAGKGYEWATGRTSSESPILSGRSPPSIPPDLRSVHHESSYWNYATESLNQAVEQTYTSLAGYLSSLGTTPSSYEPVKQSPVMENLPESPSKPVFNRQLSLKSPLNFFKNPYINVRGGRLYQPHPPSSMDAVRSLLSVVPVDDVGDNASESSHNADSASENHSWTGGSQRLLIAQTSLSSSETASQLAEGTIRAFRDLALDEAVELHATLRYWSYRWERPLLSWLEAGPTGKLIVVWVDCRICSGLWPYICSGGNGS